MNNMIKYISLTIIGFVLILVSCDTENDFYEVGSQPVSLVYPTSDTTEWILNYQKPDTMYRFAWDSRRNFIEYNLIFSLSSDMKEQRTVIFPGVRKDFYFTTMKLDSILSSMGILIAEKTDLYWTIEVIDPANGWCDEMAKISVTRCDLPTNVIMLGNPEALAEVVLDKENPKDSVTFNWNCQTVVNDYVLRIGFDEALTDALEIQCGAKKEHKLSYEYLDNWLKEKGAELGENTPVFWKVDGTGNQVNPIESSAVRKISITRFTRDPVQVTLTKPAMNSEILLAMENADQMVEFKWDCDTTGVSFKVKLFDTELGVSEEFDAGGNNSFSISQSDLDLILEQKFEMVASQKKKMYWEVIPDDPLRAVSETTGNFIIRRFMSMPAQPITLTVAPADGTAYTLNYATGGTTITSMSWDCPVVGVTYAIEYSLNSDMTQSKLKTLSSAKTYSFTHTILDDMLSDLGGAYITKTVYWRITSTVSVTTIPSDTRNMILTGMLKPLVDKRDAANPETYAVTKIGDNIWMAENLRATKYSDGTAFTTVDVASKTYSGDPINNTKITGQYYTWPTALRNWQAASTNETTIIQGVCPSGWHVSTKAEWDELITDLSPSPALNAKSTSYWATNGGITNNSGLGIVPGGIFWHNNLALPDNGDTKAAFWTTTYGPDGDDLKAYMYEFFDWSQSIDPWYYPCRPWSEGDGTASRLVNVRCVKDLN